MLLHTVLRTAQIKRQPTKLFPTSSLPDRHTAVYSSEVWKISGTPGQSQTQ